MVSLIALSLLSQAQMDLTPLDRWVVTQQWASYRRVFSNISVRDSRKGSVVASPSKVRPAYYYHWVRDGALVMRSVVDLLEEAPSQGEVDLYTTKLWEYARWVSHVQGLTTLGGMGEPRYLVDGRPFLGATARPQNHGPALRVLALTAFSRYLIRLERKDLVGQWLYGENGPLIKDLDFLARNWNQASYDLWEGLLGQHYYNRMVMGEALMAGSQVASSMGDVARAETYLTQALVLQKKLAEHWDEQWKILRSSTEVEVEERRSGLDSSVVLAHLHAGVSTLDAKLWATMDELERVFRFQYWINTRDERMRELGAAVGRYPEDAYYGGNPWFLTTLGFAQAYYEAAHELEGLESFPMDELTRAMVARMLVGELEGPLPEGSLPREHRAFGMLRDVLVAKAEAMMERVRFHAGSNGNLWEQFHRDTGFMLSAKNHSWSYAAFLEAAWKRSQVVRRD